MGAKRQGGKADWYPPPPTKDAYIIIVLGLEVVVNLDQTKSWVFTGCSVIGSLA